MAKKRGKDGSKIAAPVKDATEAPRALYVGRHGLGAVRRYEGVAERSLRTILESDHFDFPMSSIHPLDPEILFHYWPKRFRSARAMWGRLLNRETSVHPEILWHLFWALVEANRRFSRGYIRFWSHEERLTGHLITEMLRASTGGTDVFDGRRLRDVVSFYYADVASRSREAKTGADFALIFHIAGDGDDDAFKVARFQAKKAGPNGKARIDIKQLKTLSAVERLGYYIYYHAPDENGQMLPPTVEAAVSINVPDDGSRETISRNARDDTCELATFLVFALADPTSDYGRSASSPREAARIALHGFDEAHVSQKDEDPRPGRAVVISVGRVASVDWYEVLGGREMFGPTNEAE